MNIKRRIFEFLLNCQSEWRHIPTRDDVRWTFGGLTDDVDLHLEQLQREGLVRLGEGEDEQVYVTQTFEPAPEIWLRDSVLSDQPEVAPVAGRHGALTLDLRGIGVPMESEMYAVRAPDDSMIDAGIERGDVVILAQVPAKRGDIVAFEVNGRTVLRRYVVLSEIPHVLAENSARPDLRPAYDLALHGVFWGLIRAASTRRTVNRSKVARKPVRRVGGLYVRSGEEPGNLEHLLPKPGSKAEVPAPMPVAKSKVKRGRLTRKTTGNVCKNLPKPPPRIGLNDGAESIYG